MHDLQRGRGGERERERKRERERDTSLTIVVKYGPPGCPKGTNTAPPISAPRARTPHICTSCMCGTHGFVMLLHKGCTYHM